MPDWDGSERRKEDRRKINDRRGSFTPIECTEAELLKQFLEETGQDPPTVSYAVDPDTGQRCIEITFTSVRVRQIRAPTLVIALQEAIEYERRAKVAEDQIVTGSTQKTMTIPFLALDCSGKP